MYIFLSSCYLGLVAFGTVYEVVVTGTIVLRISSEVLYVLPVSVLSYGLFRVVSSRTLS